MAEALPPELRDAVARTLTPVRPLRSPERRVLALLPVAALIVGVVFSMWGLRSDVADVGPSRLWLGSALQIGVALLVLAAALAESIPGRLSGLKSLAARAGGALAFVAVLTGVTFLSSPTSVPLLAEARYVRVCLTGSFGLGLVALAAVGLLLRVGLTARPALAGALAGLGAGLFADAGWRTYCHVSHPSHVLLVHVGAVLAVAAVGAVAGALVGSWRRREGTDTTDS